MSLESIPLNVPDPVLLVAPLGVAAICQFPSIRVRREIGRLSSLIQVAGVRTQSELWKYSSSSAGTGLKKSGASVAGLLETHRTALRERSSLEA
jgi:hypothetical protein